MFDEEDPKSLFSFVERIDESAFTEEDIREFFSSFEAPPPPTPFVHVPPSQPVPPPDTAPTNDPNAANRWKCQLQYLRKHPTHVSKLLTYLMATGIVYLSQQMSWHPRKDAKRIDKSIAVTANILHSYLMAVVTLLLTLNLFFLLVVSKHPSFGIQDRFPSMKDTFGVNVQQEGFGSWKTWLFFLAFLPYHVFHSVMDEGRPVLAKWASQSLLLFSLLFTAVFLFLQMDMLSVNQSLEFLRFDAPTPESFHKIGPLHDGRIFMWTLALLLMVSAFIEFIISSRPSFTAADFLLQPQQTAEAWLAYVLQPATFQYARMFALFLVASLFWIPFGMTAVCLGFTFLAWFAIPFYSTSTFSATLSKLWTFDGKKIQRVVGLLFASLAFLHLQDSIHNIRHTVAGPLVAVINSIILVFSMLFFVFSFTTKKESS